MVKKSSPTFSTRRSCLVLILAFALLILVLSQLLIPVRHWAGQRFLARGDTLLAAQKFDEAQEEYKRAWHTDGNNSEARGREVLAREALTDIAQARDFFQQRGDTVMVAKIDQATEPYATPKEALSVGVQFMEKGEYSLARYPLQLATELDPEYPEAWHYLGLTYEKLALLDANYRVKAQEAMTRRDALTAKWR